ncbi:PTS sugar transporter subunit IIA [Devriesea agamarum]|uniref:PTS sugar transporter subunit IIA n=1 Tax=Devriesea agamarum TaxID=472569 RepID=UPI00071D9E17|nr:PTS glucose transporter subunit IIA [Devriesea agamarum]
MFGIFRRKSSPSSSAETAAATTHAAAASDATPAPATTTDSDVAATSQAAPAAGATAVSQAKTASHSDENSGCEIYAPAPGKVLSLGEVPDPVFSRGLVGPGFALVPSASPMCAPVEGTITLIPDTLHAFGITTDCGLELLVHVGIDSVGLKGQGFTALRAVGERVKAGDPVLEIDLDLLREQLPSVATPVVITNLGDARLDGPSLDAGEGEPVLRVTRG